MAVLVELKRNPAKISQFSRQQKPIQMRGKNAFERHQIAMEKAKLEITVNILQHFISIQFIFLLDNSTIILFHHSYIFFSINVIYSTVIQVLLLITTCNNNLKVGL